METQLLTIQAAGRHMTLAITSVSITDVQLLIWLAKSRQHSRPYGSMKCIIGRSMAQREPAVRLHDNSEGFPLISGSERPLI